ncbi:pentatricopeptide repeat-containing protein At1g62670, mitochondrial-like [Tripterygium wilfordii]|uniref:pentatricopeptide repeat-containing protein At1g62670, mitochondrial-like n=1 Tax=Tripterygium wilfordii TaxID=458696 RepID=UPI0018F849EC|nr:pentatricopeptide repeat-containing protein At1g62670, mitochondrial-like [Tripterygium wilfordii]
MLAHGRSPNVVTYSALLDGLCKHGYFNEVVALLKTRQESSIEPNITIYTTVNDGIKTEEVGCCYKINTINQRYLRNNDTTQRRSNFLGEMTLVSLMYRMLALHWTCNVIADKAI